GDNFFLALVKKNECFMNCRIFHVILTFLFITVLAIEIAVICDD
ncbi:unnamed protein product, partial [marine sediment metagenome]